MCDFGVCRTTGPSRAAGLPERAAVEGHDTERVKFTRLETRGLFLRAGAAGGGSPYALVLCARLASRAGAGSPCAGSEAAFPLARGQARPRVRPRKFH